MLTGLLQLAKENFSPIAVKGNKEPSIQDTDCSSATVCIGGEENTETNIVKEGGIWRKRTNKELYNLLQDVTIIKKIKIGLPRWASHVVRTDPQDPVKRFFLYDSDGKRTVGRPKLWLSLIHIYPS